MSRLLKILKAIAPFLFIERDDGTFVPMNRNKEWNVGDETISEEELVRRINEEVKQDDSTSDDSRGQ